MTVCVFLGPTLAPRAAQRVLDAVYLPPVQQGDVYRAVVRHRPRAIGIVDGYFQDVPSVWHKEILWAMARGTHVFGGASMGALRAAELATFGVRGIGRVFEAYRDGRLPPFEAEAFEDDDEVAVVHGPPETGCVALSEAMVNIRCTLAAAAGAGVICATTRDALVRAGKALFYPDRTYERLLSRAAEDGLPRPELDAFRGWLPTGRVDQKRDDALTLLATMRDFLAADPGPARVDYVFEPSEMWDRAALAALHVELDPAAGVQGLSTDALLDELRLDGLAYAEARRAGLLRLVALEACGGRRLPLGDEARREAASRLRRRLGLFGREATARWLAANDLTAPDLARLIDDEARLARLEAGSGAQATAHLLDQLRVAGDYARYAARARAKQRVLAESGFGRPHVDEWTRFRLTAWYFEERLGAAIPDDIAAHAARIGFPDLDAFYRALLGEHLYVTHGERPVSTPGPVSDAPTGPEV
jgi:hypothetical protein